MMTAELRLEHALRQLEDLQAQRDELAWALFTVLDGVPDHHIQDRFATDEDESQRIVAARRSAKWVWEINQRALAAQ
ncbi:MAG: hypothetical protein ACRC16_22035 [Aeromonas salmonicida]